MESTSYPTKDFHGLPLPEGLDRRNLYHSSFRTIATYAMPLADLDTEFRKLVTRATATIKDDKRRNFEGYGALHHRPIHRRVCVGSFPAARPNDQ